MNKKYITLVIFSVLLFSVIYSFISVQATYPTSDYIIEHDATYTKMWSEGMCKLSDDKILCLVKRGTQGSNPSTDICIQSSTDNGTSWGSLTLIKAHAGGKGFLAKELFIAPNGNLIFHYLEWVDRSHSYVFQMHSIDNGVSWVDDGRVSGTANYYGHVGNAIILSDGYTIVVTLSDSTSTSYDNALVMTSTDNGTSWTIGNMVPRPSGQPSVYEPTVVELTNGTLVMYCRSPGNGYLWKTWSTDNGLNWCEAFDSGIPSPSAPADLIRYSWTPSQILMVWDNDTTNRYPLKVAISYDECVTWENELLLQNSSLGNVAYPRFMFGTTTANDMIFVSAWINDPSYADTMGYRFPISWLNGSSSSSNSISFTSIDGNTNNSEITVSTPIFNWTIESDAIAYTLQIATDSSFSNIVTDISNINEYNHPTEYSENATHVSFTLPSNNSISGFNTYYFRARAYK